MDNKIILFIFITLGMVACRKDKPLPPIANKDSGCYSFSDNLPAQTYFTKERYQYKAPNFNPNNDYEFVYHFRDYELNTFHLIKYNLQTHQKTVLAESGKIWRQPKWSRKGWIAYTHFTNYVDHIYIVKDNGDSLIQFTDNTANYAPVWNTTGNELYWIHSPVLGVPYNFLKKNIYNSSIDTVLYESGSNQGYATYNDVSTNNQLLSLTFIDNQRHIAKASLNEDPISFSSIVDMFNTFDYPNPSGLCWSSDEKSIFVSIPTLGLYKIELESSNIQLLIPFCDSKRYTSISGSTDGKHLIGERVDSYLKLDEQSNPTGEIVENSSIYLIDLTTLEEIKVELEP